MNREAVWKMLCVVRRLVNHLPHRAALRVGQTLGTLLWIWDKKRVDGAEARCVRALGVGMPEARHIVRRSYGNIGRSVVEFLRLSQMKGQVKRFVTVHGEEHLRDALARGKGVILLTAHFGSWEMAAAWLAERGYPMNAIGAEQRDPRISDLIAELRRSCGVVTIGKGFDLKEALRCLRKGEILGVLLDQDPKDRGIVVPFLGLPASTPYGPVKMAFKLQAPVVPLFMVRREDGIFHDLHFLPPLEGKEGMPFGEDEKDAVRRSNDVLSEWIVSHPEQWMWLYPRWASTEAMISC